MQTFPGNCTRNQIEEFPRTRINISVWQYSPVRSLAACARATPKIHCPSTGVYRRSPQLTRIEISTFFLYTDYGRSLTRNAAPVQARSLHEEYRVQASRYKPRASPWDSKHRNGKRVYGICASPYVVGARTCTGYCPNTVDTVYGAGAASALVRMQRLYTSSWTVPSPHRHDKGNDVSVSWNVVAVTITIVG